MRFPNNKPIDLVICLSSKSRGFETLAHTFSKSYAFVETKYQLLLVKTKYGKFLCRTLRHEGFLIMILLPYCKQQTTIKSLKHYSIRRLTLGTGVGNRPNKRGSVCQGN